MVGDCNDITIKEEHPMAKRNRLRYQSSGNQYPRISMTGQVFLRHLEEDAIAQAAKGDVQIFLSTDALPANRNIGNYEAMGLEGYLKAEVHDGKGWKPLSLEEFFPHRDYYFGKRERPLDTYNVCVSTLRKSQGTTLMRTYREHYVKTEEERDPAKS
jgi:hypothetical protein